MSIKQLVVHVRTCETLGYFLALGSFNGKERDEAIANAHLIFAAPDLLAMVKRYAGECSTCDGTGERDKFNNFCNIDKVDCDACTDIRALIAKAECAPTAPTASKEGGAG